MMSSGGLQACRELPALPPNVIETNYLRLLMLTVLDIQMPGKAVENAVNHFEIWREFDIKNHDGLRSLLGQYQDSRDGNLALARHLWKYDLWSRVEILRRLVEFLDGIGVSDYEGLRAWAERSSFATGFSGKVQDLGLQSYEMLRMRLGLETSSPTQPIRDFFETILGRAISDAAIMALMQRLAECMGISINELDWRIWASREQRK